MMRRAIVRKESNAGIGYSVVELHNVRHIFAAAVPRKGETLREQTRDALRTIERVIDEEGTRGSIVHQAVFIRDYGLQEECRRLIKEFYGSELPATTYISQPPCDGKLVSIEALGVGSGHNEVEIERHSEQLVITRHSGVSWIHCGQVVPQIQGGGVYDRSVDAFAAMRRLLCSVGVRFDQVIRTWLYLGDIVGPEGETQRYKELNRARTDFFHDIRFAEGKTPAGHRGAVYPASTGIGTSNGDVVMSSIAIATDRDDLTLIPLENPQQTSAFDYGAVYSPKSPKFARAMALSCGKCATIFVSGTASITDSESRHEGDAAAQTHQTLDNIEALISERNFQGHGTPGLGATLDDLALVRVYIKRQEDYAKTRAACEERLGELPTIYAIADVCRPELLVEIEGIAFSHRCGG
jgi:enamine deaminase RidA (YjgF/YER057c/UK114 family)